MSEIQDIEKIQDPATRARAYGDYLSRLETARSRVVELRKAAIREVLQDHGTAETARLCGVSPSTVKLARG